MWSCLLLSSAATLAQQDKVTKVGDRYGIELDVVFTYHPEEENISRWKSVFSGASVNLYSATNGHFFLKKVNLYVCPMEEEKRTFKPDADVIIFRDNGRNSAVGRLYNSQTMSLYDRGRSIAEDQESVAHELCHYIFGIRDEYAPETPTDLARLQLSYSLKSRPDIVEYVSKTWDEAGKEGKIAIQSTQDEQSLINEHGGTKFVYRLFCFAPFFKAPDSCIMDGVGVLQGTEYYGELCSADDHATGTFTLDSQSEIAVWSRNPQSWRHGKSCRSTAEEVLKSAYGLTVDLSSQLTGIPPETDFVEKNDCEDVVVLLLDKSGSMAGLPLAELKGSVIALIDLLSDDVKLGIVWFDSQPRAAVGIQKLGDSRELAKLAVTPISASGGTRIAFGLGVAYEQILLFRDPDKPRGKETIYLVTDGISSDDTTTVVNTIVNDGVKINPIALGDGVDTFGLFEMARRSGGRTFIARDNEDITRVVVQGTAETLENYFVLSDRPSEPLSGSIPIEVDAYVGRLLIQLTLTGIDPSAVQHEQFRFETESGASIPLVVRSEALGPDSASVVVEIDQPPAGTHILEIPPALLTGSPQASVLAFGQSTQLQWKASLASGKEAFQYPEPVVIEAAVHSFLGSAHGMEVSATITRPDGTEIALKLFDDGSPIHGDEIPNDGLYSAKFLNFNGDGTYQVKVAGRADETTLAGAGAHTITLEGAQTFEPFSREQNFSFEVAGFQAPEESTVTVEKLPLPLDAQQINTEVSGSTGVILGGFKVSVGPGQGAKFSKLTLDASGEKQDIESFKRFALYIDADKDGLVDFMGPTSQPQSISEATIVDGAVVLTDVLQLEGDTSVQILLVGLYEMDVETTVLESGMPLLVLPLILLGGLLLCRRRGFALLTLLCLAASGSGCGDHESFVFTNGSDSPVNEQVTARDFQTDIRLDGIEAVGRIDGEALEVKVIGDPVVDGPMVKIR